MDCEDSFWLFLLFISIYLTNINSHQIFIGTEKKESQAVNTPTDRTILIVK